MPETDAVFFPKDELLSFEEIERLARLLVERCGIRDIRLTGGEPLVRKDLPQLVRMLSGIRELKDFSLTTNGILLTEHALALRNAGLKRLNISLDTLSEKVFQKITRRPGLQQTLDGIEQAIACKFNTIKLNALAIKGITENEVCRLAEFASQRKLTLRFIEYMPLDTDRSWQRTDVLDGDQLLGILKKNFGTPTPIERDDPSQPAEEFLIGGNRVGIIRSVSQPFCEQCNRLRITADGAIRNCLFSNDEVSLKRALRNSAGDDQLIELFQASVRTKAASHGIQEDGFRPPERPMYAIGG